jgi:membrane peptidoglycan carboxypeptidase
MLEVYFNIIEWVLIMQELAKRANIIFKTTDLSLNECLFLARIIPSPRRFMYQFNDQGNLRDFAAKQDAFLTNLMTKRGLLPIEDTLTKRYL